MANLKEADFYYGAAISMLFNKGVCPMLIEGGENRQIYEFTTDKGDFRLFLKYRKKPTTDNDGYLSWQFVLTQADIVELRSFLDDEKQLSVGLVCGMGTMNKSEYAVLHKEDLKSVLDSGKTSISISRKTREKAYRLSVGGGRENAIMLKSNCCY